MATINTGAKVKITVYYGMIRILDQDFDICENLDQVDMKCPIEKGEITVTKGVDIPKQIPPVRFSSSTSTSALSSYIFRFPFRLADFCEGKVYRFCQRHQR